MVQLRACLPPAAFVELFGDLPMLGLPTPFQPEDSDFVIGATILQGQPLFVQCVGDVLVAHATLAQSSHLGHIGFFLVFLSISNIRIEANYLITYIAKYNYLTDAL